MAHKTANKLIHESSPYLLQHAYNPVNWYPWGEETLQKAVDENKPILVSIGYAACHWCHVMERESFEDEATASIMNAHFINIKIDREERPDLDHIYMDAVQAMTGSGGWPLNVFLTPAGKPFYGGTYFPPRRAYNRASWQETLHSVVQAFRERRHEIDAQAENLTQHIQASNAFGTRSSDEENYCTPEQTKQIAGNMLNAADKQWGGFGNAPKFPQTFSIQYLLRYAHLNDKNEPELSAAAREQAFLSLDKMIAGGIYDQVGGGFARYSTDTEWLAPHFEKMLYDNALLIGTLCEAYQLSGNTRYREVVIETMEFIQRELMHPSYGFYAALDADSEGVEGKFYTWQKKEIEEALGEKAALFNEYYGVSEAGNWEHTNILWVQQQLKEFAAINNIAVDALEALLKEGREKLLSLRSNRIRPLTDDKIILGWNALMNKACSQVYAITGDEKYRELAVNNMQFLLSAFKSKEGVSLHHTWKNDEARYPAFLDDYAYLIDALLALQEITADTHWLDKAIRLAGHVIANFSEEDTGYFYYTPAGQADIIVRKKEVYDGAVPSGNAVMANILWRLSILANGDEAEKRNWADRSRQMLNALGKAVTRYPTSFGCWASFLMEIAAGTSEIAVLSAEKETIMKEILVEYIPFRVMMASGQERGEWPLLADKPLMAGKHSIFLCRNYTCQAPVFSAKELISLINSANKSN